MPWSRGIYLRVVRIFQYLQISVICHINKLNKNEMIISTDADKKLLIKFIIHLWQKLQKVGAERTYFNVIKAIYDKPTANIIFNGESISSKMRNKTRMSCLTMFIQHSFGSHSYSNKRRNIKWIQIGKAVKLSLFAGNMKILKMPPESW